jgi:uncharacterized membrane protein
MDVFLGDWANLLLRWAHLVVGIGWIGTSFYFMALDYSLDTRERQREGVHGTAWQVHGGGFYRVEKFSVAPPSLPAHLHWFTWEAYLTWMTGFGLLVVQYYLHAPAYMINPSVMRLDPWQAAALSVGSLAVGWVVYDVLCRSPLGERAVPLALGVFVLILAATVFYARMFSARAALVHVGAFIGTIMAVNVFAIIIPNQKKMVAQLLRGEQPNPRYGEIGKQRSTHNNYLTLPVLLLMVAPHYPFLASHPQPWLIVALIILIGALARHFFNRIDAGDDFNLYGWAAFAAVFLVAVAVYLTAPAVRATTGSVSDSEVLAIAKTHCTICHAKKPVHESFAEAPKNVTLESIADLRRFAPLVLTQTVVNKAMPLGNQTQMTDAERAKLGQWIAALK